MHAMHAMHVMHSPHEHNAPCMSSVNGFWCKSLLQQLSCDLLVTLPWLQGHAVHMCTVHHFPGAPSLSTVFVLSLLLIIRQRSAKNPPKDHLIWDFRDYFLKLVLHNGEGSHAGFMELSSMVLLNFPHALNIVGWCDTFDVPRTAL